VTNRTIRTGFHQRQRAAYSEALRNPTAAEARRRVCELADAGRTEQEIAETVGLDLASVRRTIGERSAA
jgi:hypothetical protein